MTPRSPVEGVSRLGNYSFNVDPSVNIPQQTIPISGIITDPTKVTINLSLSAG